MKKLLTILFVLLTCVAFAFPKDNAWTQAGKNFNLEIGQILIVKQGKKTIRFQILTTKHEDSDAKYNEHLRYEIKAKKIQKWQESNSSIYYKRLDGFPSLEVIEGDQKIMLNGVEFSWSTCTSKSIWIYLDEGQYKIISKS